jgi:hypothetical protein
VFALINPPKDSDDIYVLSDDGDHFEHDHHKKCERVDDATIKSFRGFSDKSIK